MFRSPNLDMTRLSSNGKVARGRGCAGQSINLEEERYDE